MPPNPLKISPKEIGKAVKTGKELVEDLFDFWKAKQPGTNPAPKNLPPANPLPPATGLQREKWAGDPTKVLTFKDAMDSAEAGLRGIKVEDVDTPGEVVVFLKEFVMQMTVGEIPDDVLERIHEEMKKKLLGQKKPRATSTKKYRERVSKAKRPVGRPFGSKTVR